MMRIYSSLLHLTYRRLQVNMPFSLPTSALINSRINNSMHDLLISRQEATLQPIRLSTLQIHSDGSEELGRIPRRREVPVMPTQEGGISCCFYQGTKM